MQWDWLRTMPFSQKENLVSLELQLMYTDTRKQQGKGSVLVPAKFHPSAGDPGASQCQLLVQLGKRHPLIIWVNVPQDWAELIGFWKRCQNIALRGS